ncbi:MAG: GNAT family N-acetyltransferase [Nocardioides sp.]
MSGAERTVTGLTVRLTTVEDWQAWRDLRLRSLQDSPDAFGSTYAREAAFTDDDWRDRARGAAPGPGLEVQARGPAVLAWAGDRPVGMGGGFSDLPGWLHIVAMWTDPAWRGRGVGEAVVGFLVEWAAGRGLRVHLDVETGNAGARRLYERCGFVGTGETRPLREGSAHVVERMVLPS